MICDRVLFGCARQGALDMQLVGEGSRNEPEGAIDHLNKYAFCRYAFEALFP